MLLRPRRSHRLTLLAAGTLLASPLLAGCGFDYATDRVNTLSAGVTDRSGTVDVLGAVVIAGQDDIGVFAATLVNKDTEEAITLQGVQPGESTTAAGTPVPVEIPAGGRTSLFQTGGLPVSGAFKAGDFVPVALQFSDGQVTTITVNVVTPCHQYSLDKLTEITLPTPAAGTEGATTGEDPEVADARYSCDPLPPVEHGPEGGTEGEGGAEGEAGAEGAEATS